MADSRKLSAKQSLEKAFEKAGLDKRHLAGPLRKRYCAGFSALSTFDLWYKNIFPKFEPTMLSPDRIWVRKLVDSVAAIKSKPSLAQRFLNNKAVAFLKVYPLPNNDFWLKNFSKGGYCDGFAFFAANFLASEIQKQLKINSDANKCWLGAIEKLENLLAGLRNFSEKDELLKNCKAEDILEMLKEVGEVEHSRFMHGELCGSWHTLSEKFSGVRFAQVDATFDDFTEENVLSLIENFLAYKQSEIKEKCTLEVLRIAANAHATVIIKIIFKDKSEPIILYYDANSHRLLSPFNSKNAALLAKIICLAHGQKDDNPTVLRVQHFVVRQTGYRAVFTPHLLAGKTPAPLAAIANKIFWSIRVGNINLFEKYIDELKNTNIPTMALVGETALNMAAQWCALPVVESLLKLDLPINLEAKRMGSKRRAVHFAALFNVEILEILLDHGAEIDPVSKLGTKLPMTPLMIAAKYGRVEAVKLLLSLGANVNFKTIGDVSILHIAVERNHIEVVKLLIAHRANLLATTSTKKTLIDVAKTGEMRALIQEEMTKQKRAQKAAKQADKRAKKSRDVLLFQSLFGGVTVQATQSPVATFIVQQSSICVR